MAAIGYCRVSTRGQADRGVSLSVQKKAIRDFAANEGLDLTAMIIVDESGYGMNHPGIKRLVKIIKQRRVEAVLVYSLDRLARSLARQNELLNICKQAGVDLVVITQPLDLETAMGKLSANVNGSFNQYWCDFISERTRAALKLKKSRGERLGNVPYGFRVGSDGKHIEKDAAEQRVLSYVRWLRNHGYSLRKMAARLNAKGYRTRAGFEWRHEYINNLIKHRI